MTDLERFAAVLLAEWLQEGRHPGDPIAVGSLLDRTLPYRTARKLLGIDVSEDYEMLVLRLIAEEDGLVRTEPSAAAAMARDTLSSKLPDLDLLHRLHSAAMTFTDEAIDRLEGVRPMPASPSAPPVPPVVAEAPPTPRTVFPIRPEVEMPSEGPTPPRVQDEPPAEFLTGVAFTPPAPGCWSCHTPLPSDRVAKFCVACGADQRAPSCPNCGTTVERGWSFCPECGGGVG